MSDDVRLHDPDSPSGPKPLGATLAAAVFAISFVALVAGVVLIWQHLAAQREAATTPASSPPLVRAIVIAPTDRPVIVEATGFLRSPATVRIAAETQGKLVRKLKNEGDVVAPNDIVAVLDDRVYRRRIDAAEARATSLDTQLAYVDKELGRERELADLGSGRLADLDRWQSEKQRLDAAKLENAASLEEAKLWLEKCEVRSTQGGVWYQDLAEEGEFLAPAQPIGLVRSVDALELEVEVSGKVRLGLEPGATVDVEILDVDPELTDRQPIVADCRIDRLPVGENPVSRRFPVVVSVPNTRESEDDGPGGVQTGPWIPGLFARVRFRLDRRRALLLVPKEAVFLRHGERALWVAARSGGEDSASRAELRYVAVRSVDDMPGKWSVVGGLELGERVIIAPIEKMTEKLAITLEAHIKRGASEPQPASASGPSSDSAATVPEAGR